MRIALTSFIVLMGLLISAAATAGHHEADAKDGAEAAEEMPPVEASPPDTKVATPAKPAMPDHAKGKAKGKAEVKEGKKAEN